MQEPPQEGVAISETNSFVHCDTVHFRFLDFLFRFCPFYSNATGFFCWEFGQILNVAQWRWWECFFDPAADFAFPHRNQSLRIDGLRYVLIFLIELSWVSYFGIWVYSIVVLFSMSLDFFLRLILGYEEAVGLS